MCECACVCRKICAMYYSLHHLILDLLLLLFLLLQKEYKKSSCLCKYAGCVRETKEVCKNVCVNASCV